MLTSLRDRWSDTATATVTGWLAASLSYAEACDAPFQHWLLADALPPAVLKALRRLPLDPPRRQADEATRAAFGGRHYITRELAERHPICATVARAFQDRRAVNAISRKTGARLDGSRLRLELTLDVDGFQLTPHTDLGAKRFTLLIYIDAEGQRDLGTDIYRDAKTWCKQAPFRPGAALAFIPGADTWHGLEPRLIKGVRRCLVVNYVDPTWNDQQQLTFPELAVSSF